MTIKGSIMKKTAMLAAICLLCTSLSGCLGQQGSQNDVSSEVSSEVSSAQTSAAVESESDNGLVELPSFLSQTEGEAIDFLDDNGLKYSIVREYIDSVDKHTVISQEPKAGSMIARGSEVKLVVAMGTDEASSKPTSSKAASSKDESSKAASSKAASSKDESSKTTNDKVEVPNIVGMQSTTAQNTLSALDLYYTGSYEFSRNIPAGEVISQSPKAGTIVSEHSRVTFVISSGPRPETDSDTDSEEESQPEESSQAPSSVPSEGGGDRYIGSYSSFRPTIRIEGLGDDFYYINVLWSASASEGVSYEFYAEYNPVSDTLEYTDGEAYYYRYNYMGQMVEYSLMDDGYLGYFKLYSHNDLRWSDMSVGIGVDSSFTRN